MLLLRRVSPVSVAPAALVAAVLVLASAASAMLPSAQAASGIDSAETVVFIDPPSVNAWPEGVFEIAVSVENVSSLGAFQFTLAYEEEHLEFEGLEVGEFLGSTGREVNALEPVTETGKVTFGAFSMPGAPGPSGSGELATVEFRGRGEADTFLRIDDVALADIANNPIDVAELNGAIVSIRAGPTPAPEYLVHLPAVLREGP